jgi:hypothetical protein
VRKNSSVVIAGVLLVSLALAPACGGGNAPARTTGTSQCEGATRPQLDCDSEIAFDARKIGGSFSALGATASASTETIALRQVDESTKAYVVQWKRLCEEYNRCVLDRETYSTRSENLRRRLAKLPELYDAVKSARDDTGRAKALHGVYTEIVPDEQRVEIALDFSVLAKRASEVAFAPIAQGATLPTETRVAFFVQTSRPAHVYLFQKTPDGRVNVIFPDARIGLKNPIVATSPIRIPAGEQSYRVNEKDIGLERVFVVASLQPIASLEADVARLNAGEQGGAGVASLSAIGGDKPGCTARALELDTPGQATTAAPCVRSRGLELDAPPSSGAKRASMHVESEAGDGVIAKLFSFNHTSR